MSESESQLKSELVSLANRFEIEPEEVVEIYKDKLVEVKEGYTIPLSPDEEQAAAIRMTQAHLVSDRATSGVSYGGGEEVEVLSVGYTEGSWRIKDDDGNFVKDANGEEKRRPVLYGNAIIYRDGQESRATVLVDSLDGHDLSEWIEALDTLNCFTSTFTVSESEGLPNAYKIFLSAEAELEEESEHFGKMSMTDRLDKVNKFTDKVDLLNVLDHLSSTTTQTNGRSYLTDFGIDVKRIEGTVLSTYRAKDSDRGNYVVLDDTILDPEQELAGSPLVNERTTVPGLTIWTSKNRVKYGKGSRCVFYGVMNKNTNTAQVSMELRGVFPLSTNSLETESANTTTTSI